MRNRPRSYALVSAAVGLLAVGCFVPQHLWPQGDLQAGPPAPAESSAVLLASRSSDFKAALAEEVSRRLEADSIYVEVVGIDDLDDRDVEDYRAVVILNSCIAWGHDADVSGFLEDHLSRHGRMVVVTTSGDGEWAPDVSVEYDALSAASELSEVDRLAEEVAERVRALPEA